MKSDGSAPEKATKFTNNGLAHLFNEIRYEINGIAVDSIIKVDSTSTIKGIMSFTPHQVRRLQYAGWIPSDVTNKLPFTDSGEFTVCLPLDTLMVFF